MPKKKIQKKQQRNRLSKMRVNMVSLVDRGAGLNADVVISKRDDTNPTNAPSTLRADKEDPMGTKTKETDLTKMDPTELVEYAKSLETTVVAKDAEIAEKDTMITTLAEVVDDLGPAGDPGAPVDFTDDKAVEKFLKTLDHESKGLAEALLRKARDADARASESEKIAKAEREIRLTKRFEDEAKELSDLPGVEPEDVSKALHTLFVDHEETYDLVSDLLKKVNAAYGDAPIFREIGRETPNVGTDVEKVAEGIRKDDPSLTKEQSIAKAYELRPDLYDPSKES